MKTGDNIPSKGTITSRKCPVCGHHEIGYTTEEGTFHSLKPGDLIQVIEGPELSPRPTVDKSSPISNVEKIESRESKYRIWVPEPVRGDKTLCLKYGVLVKEEFLSGEISGEIYRAAYLEKFQRLIEKEVNTPIPVILDRFFTAPHLGSGNPRQVAEAMWRDLDEIKGPVVLVSRWIEKRDEESLAKMIYPGSKDDLGDQPESDKKIERELKELSLEAFLELL